ncbi:Uncharacterised protein [Acinetobacter baumannii]|nr:Uncharacterised protein [Acinetobacter baumannii]
MHFAADDLGKQTRCGHAFRDNCWRHIGNFYLDLGAVGLTLPAAVFQPHVSKHPDLCWDELELLTDFFTHLMQRMAAAGTGFIVNIMDNINARQLRGNPWAAWLSGFLSALGRLIIWLCRY